MRSTHNALGYALTLAATIPLSAGAAAFQQVETIWERASPATGGPEERFHDLEVLPDGTSYSSVTVESSPTVREAVITRRDANGAVVWTHSQPLTTANPIYGWQGEGYRDLAVATNGDLFASLRNGTSLSLERRTPDGTLVWSAPYHGEIRALPDGGCVVARVRENMFFRTRIRRIDAAGNLVWTREVRSDRIEDMHVDSFGNTFLLAWNLTSHYVDLPISTGRISYAGDVAFTSCEWLPCLSDGPRWFGNETLWNNQATLPIQLVFDARGHAFMMLAWGNHGGWMLVSFDRTGAYTWHHLQASTPVIRHRRVAVDGDGSAWLAGVGGDDLGLRRFTPGGAPAWETVVSPGAGELPFTRIDHVVLDEHGVTTVTGTRGSGNDRDPFLLRFDAGGALLGEAGFVHRTAGSYSLEAGSRLALDDAGRMFHGYTTQDPTGMEGSTVRKLTPGAAVGTPVCDPAQLNSTGGPATITALGTDEAALDDVTLRVSGLPLGSVVLLLTGTQQQSVAFPGGSQGVLCLGGDLGRYRGPGQIQSTAPDGTISLLLDLANTPGATGTVSVLAGETRLYQAWYRDANPTATSNFTSAVEIVFR